MTVKHYYATADNTITNAYSRQTYIRATGSNMGASPILEVFSIYGDVTNSDVLSGSSELSRVLIKFDTSTMATDRTNGDLPASGSVNFYLKMCNAKHSQTVPSQFFIDIKAITADWEVKQF